MTTYTDSQIGYNSGTLSNPTLYVDSQIGFKSGSLSNPAVLASSQIGFASGTLRFPHKPVGVLDTDGTTILHGPFYVWNGTSLT